MTPITESEAMKQTVTVGNEFISNNGNGPLHARVVAISEGTVTMQRWRGSAKKKYREPISFCLPRWFIETSPACGWRKP